MMHAGYDDGGAIHQITEEEFGNELGYDIWLNDMRVHCNLKHGMQVCKNLQI